MPTATSATPIPSGKTWNGTVVYAAATGAQTVVNGTYNNLTLSNTSGTNTAGGDLAVNATLTTTAGGILDIGTNLLSGTLTTITNNGTISTAVPTATSATPIPSGKTWNGAVVYAAATGAQTVVTGTYNNLTLSNTSGTNTAGGDLTVNGTLTTSAGGTLNLGTNLLSGTLTTITNNGTISTAVPTATSATPIPSGKTWGGTIEYKGTGAQTLVVGTFNNLILSTVRSGSPAITLASGTINISGNFTKTATGIGSFTTTGNTVNYTSTNGGQTVAMLTYNNLTVSNTSGTNTAGGDLTVNGTLTTTGGGILDLGTNLLSGSLTTIANNGTISTAVPTATSATPIPSGKTWNGTVVYTAASGVQTVVAGTYTNLSFTSPASAMGGNITCSGALQFVNATSKLAIASNTLTLSGTTNMSATACLVANGSSNITLNGSGALGSALFFDQSTPGTTNKIANLTYNRSAQTITLGNPLQVTNMVTPTAGTLASAGFLTLVSDANGTAGIANGGCSSCSYITGNVQVQRYIPPVERRWRFMGSTVQSTTLADWKNELFITGVGGAANGFDASAANAPSNYYYNESSSGTLNNGWLTESSISNPLVVGRGYRMFVRGDRSNPGRLDGTVSGQNAVSVDLVGVPNQGDITMPVSCTFTGAGSSFDSNNDGWNLIANPYPCSYDWNAHYDSGTNLSNIGPTIWILNAQNGSYSYFNAASDMGDLTGGIIPSGASFWVKATGAAPSLTFKEQYKVGAAPINTLYKTAPIDSNPSFSIKFIQDSITWDQLTVKYMAGTTTNYDAWDIQSLGGIVSVASWGSDNVKLNVDVRPYTTLADTIRLYINGAAGARQLVFLDNNTSMPFSQSVLLYDTYTSTVTDLKATNTYNFSILSGIAATQGANRFYLVIAPPSSMPLPVKLVDFSAHKQNEQHVLIQWTTAQELNCKAFEVQRSTNGTLFETITSIPGHKNSYSLQNYQYVDQSPMSKNYYRLKQIDWDGQVVYSDIRYIALQERVPFFTLYPVPITDILTVEHATTLASLTIYNAMGTPLLLLPLDDNPSTQVDVSKLAAGVYIVEASDVLGNTIRKKVFKR